MSARYSAIIFDLFGTLVPAYAHRTVLRAMSEALGLDPEPFTAAFAEQTRDRRETGGFESLEENLRTICDEMGCVVPSSALRRAVTIRRDFTVAAMAPRADALPTLTALRARHLRIGMISNCCEVVPPAWRTHPLAPFVDVAFFSCEVGLRKPNPAIYQAACNELRIEPGRCLYLGDGGSDELSGASALGMDAVLLAIAEENAIDPYRAEASRWQGRTIESLEAVVGLV